MLVEPTTVRILGGWRATGFALLAAVLLTGGIVQTLRLHYTEARLAHYASAAAKAEMARQLSEQASNAELARLRATAPKAGKTIREVVHNHPSDCRVPAADKLRDAVRQSNTARGLPSDATSR